MSAVIVRILLRVLAGAIAGWGLRDVADLVAYDPTVEEMLIAGMDVAIGVILWAGAEIWYWIAKRLGWRT